MSLDLVSQAMALDGPGPMVGKHHPVESHLAADKAAVTAIASRTALLRLLAEIGPVDAADFTEEYHARYLREGWPRLGADSPRKRLEDLVHKYALAERTTDRGHIGRNGLPKGEYRITAEGWDYLRAVAA